MGVDSSTPTSSADIDSTLKDYKPPVTINSLWDDFVKWVTEDIWL